MKPRGHGRKLTTYVGLLALSLVLPCFIFAAVATWKWTAAERARLSAHTVDTTDSALAQLDRYLASVIGMLQALATSPAVDTGDFARFDAQARDLLSLQDVHTVLRHLTGK